jgi:hypothetical protein
MRILFKVNTSFVNIIILAGESFNLRELGTLF